MIPQAYFNKVKRYFNDDAAKAWLWFKTRNPALGSVSPLEMIKAGKVAKLQLFIDSQLEGNLP
jgi:hypothetical protein